jgi:hypothetical protein
MYTSTNTEGWQETGVKVYGIQKAGTNSFAGNEWRDAL